MIQTVPAVAWADVAADCDAAADLMPTDAHWTQADYQSGWPTVRYCLVGAVVAARRRRDPMAPPYAERALIAQLGPDCYASLECWNDEIGRTRAEVVALLRATAADARAAHGRGAGRFDGAAQAIGDVLTAFADQARARSWACLRALRLAAFNEPRPPLPLDIDVIDLDEELEWLLRDRELVDA